MINVKQNLLFKTIVILILLLAGWRYPTKTYSAHSDWTVVKEKNGIKIFTKSQPVSGYKIIRAVFVVPESVAACLALIKDSHSANLWMNRVVKFETLEETNHYEWFTYGELDIPWPLDNKDFVSHNIVLYDEKTQAVTVKIKSKPDFIPEKKVKIVLENQRGFGILPPRLTALR